MAGRVQTGDLELSAARRSEALSAWRASLRPLDRVLAAAGLEALLAALLEGAPAVDSCALFAADRDRLRRIASAGLASELDPEPDGLALLAGRNRAPASVRDAADDPLLEGSAVAARGLRALEAVPLVEGGTLLGVLEAGSRTAYELGDADRILLRAAAARATSLLSSEELRARNEQLTRRLALQNDLARVLAAATGIDEALREVLASACSHLGWDAGLAWVADKDGAIRCRATWAADGVGGSDLEKLCIELTSASAALPVRVVQSGEPIWVSNLEQSFDLARRDAFARAGMRCAFLVPMRLGDVTLGALELLSREPRELSERQPVETLGRQVGQLLRRARSQEEVRQSEALKAAILASALDAFVGMDADGRIVEWNEAAEHTFGWKREEAVGRKLSEMIIPHRLQAEHEDSLRKQVASGEPSALLGKRVEMPAMHRDGHEFPVELAVTRVDRHGSPLFTGTLRDITDRKRAERAARRVTETFQALVEASPLPIIAHDAGGRVIIWNRAAEQVSGWSRNEVLGQPDPFLPSEAHTRAQQMPRKNGHNIVAELEVERQRKDGSRVVLSVSIAPLRTARGQTQPGTTGTIAIAADVTEKQRAQMEAAQTVRFREHFVGIVGHDLRNPLSAIVTASQLLLRHGGLVERQAKAVARISSSADRMARMIADLLDFTRSRLGGGFPIQTRRSDLRELCAAVIEELELAYPSRSIEFEARGDAWGNWDPDRMAQVVSNLVGNALQHSPDTSTVRVDLRDEGDRVLLETSNAGTPIPPEMIPLIFEPGRRGPPGVGRQESSGLGLGLFIVQQIVLAHGGEIIVRSSAAEGTTFAVSLPRRSRALP